MYSQKIVSQRLSKLHDHGIRVTRFSRDEILNWREHLSKKYPDWDGVSLSSLTTDERQFVENERILTKYDFRYWHDNYCVVQYDPNITGRAGVGLTDLWESQEMLLQRIAETEESNWELKKQGHPGHGIKVADHKARQLGHTHIARALSTHLTTRHLNIRGLAASVSDDMVKELWDRDKRIIANLPNWLLPPAVPKKTYFENVKEYMHWQDSGSIILFQQANQMTGLGQGRQFEVAHLTEVADWPDPDMIRNDFMPTVEHPANLTILESTAQGRGNFWHKFTESVRRGKQFGWVYHFTPWYVEKKKYWAIPPDDWKPNKMTELHLEKCRNTSPEFCFGKTVTPTWEQLYWYEKNRESAMEEGTLNYFLANYCATPEESFQHSGISAFPTEWLEEQRARVQSGVPYEIHV